jgi:hypothetical protein
MNEGQSRLYEYFINNPCLSEEIDYEEDGVREKHYKDLVMSLPPQDVRDISSAYGV